jgi:SsrA-binding protein
MAIKVIAANKKAYHDYFIGDSIEAGIVLSGSEIKSIRAGSVNIRDSYVKPDNKSELWIENMHVARYDPASYMSHDPVRKRKLLLHKKEIRNLADKVAQKGYTLVATRLYLKDGRAKLEVALAKGKKLYNKKEDIAKRDIERDLQRSYSRDKF